MKHWLLLATLMVGLSSHAAENAKSTADSKPSAAPKANSGLGISITGNLEAPKVLYILPWKTVEEGAPDPYVSGIIEEVFSPVDPVEFERTVQWHALGQAASATDVNKK